MVAAGSDTTLDAPQQDRRRNASGRAEAIRAGLVMAGLILVAVLMSWTAVRIKHMGIHRWMEALPMFSFAKGEASFTPSPDVENLDYHGDGRGSLGQFSVRIFDPLSHRVVRVDFQLDATTHCRDKLQFQKLLSRRYRFIREQVAVAVRNCTRDDLRDPELTLLKKRIIARVNRVLEQPFLKSVRLPQFSVYESDHGGRFAPLLRSA